MPKKEYNENLYIKWLDMIESNIFRMSNLSEQNKKFTFAVTTALIALIPTNLCINPCYIIIISIVGQIVLMFINIYYLTLEKAYRVKFNKVVIMMNNQCPTNEYLLMEIEEDYYKKYFGESVKSISIWPIYATLISINLVSLYLITI